MKVNNLKKIDFRFRMRTDTASALGILFDYLSEGSYPPYSSREMVIQALKSYWMPFAYCRSDFNQRSVAKRLARESIASLQQQIRELEEYFELVETDSTESLISNRSANENGAPSHDTSWAISEDCF